MSRDSLKGNAPVTMVTSVPWKRERDITVIAVIAASSAKRRSVQILTYCRGRCIYTASRARHICMLRDNWPVIDWREPIGLQERLEGRSSHNGVISVMSRSRFQGTEVTIVTGAFCNFSNVCCCFTFERQLMRDHWRSVNVLSVWDCLQFSALIGRTRDSLHIRWAVGGDCSQRLRDRLTLTECWAQTGCIEPNSAFKH